MEHGQCRLCSAPIIWVRSAATNHLLGLDAEPVPEGGNVVIVEGRAVVFRGDLFEEQISGPRYREHAETCAGMVKRRKRQ